jgi:hypothetical protein
MHSLFLYVIAAEFGSLLSKQRLFSTTAPHNSENAAFLTKFEALPMGHHRWKSEIRNNIECPKYQFPPQDALRQKQNRPPGSNRRFVFWQFEF